MYFIGCTNNNNIDCDESRDGVSLFESEVRSVVLTPINADAEIRYSAGSYVTLCWITSQDVSEDNLTKLRGGGVGIMIKGDSYFPYIDQKKYLSGEILTEEVVNGEDIYRIFHIYSEQDWEEIGVEIIDTHENKEIPYDNCEFVYRGWLEVTLGGEDEEHRFIKLKSIAEAPEGYETARLYFNPAYDFVNNMITVIQRGYASVE